MKRIKMDLPEGIMCAFLNYVFIDEDGHMKMGVHSIDGKELDDGHVEVKPQKEEAKNEG